MNLVENSGKEVDAVMCRSAVEQEAILATQAMLEVSRRQQVANLEYLAALKEATLALRQRGAKGGKGRGPEMDDVLVE